MLCLIYHLLALENSIKKKKGHNYTWGTPKTPPMYLTEDLWRSEEIQLPKGKEIPKENLLNWLFNYNINLCYQKLDADREGKETKTEERAWTPTLHTSHRERLALAPTRFIHSWGGGSDELQKAGASGGEMLVWAPQLLKGLTP